jgi:hypothetical protein
MLALNSIFLLVTQHGLEYPRFYERLYGLLTPEVFLVGCWSSSLKCGSYVWLPKRVQVSYCSCQIGPGVSCSPGSAPQSRVQSASASVGHC